MQAADVAIAVVRLLDQEFPVDKLEPSIVAATWSRPAVVFRIRQRMRKNFVDIKMWS